MTPPAEAAVARGATIHAPARSRTATRRPPARRRSGAVARPRSGSRPRSLALPRYDFVAILDRLLRGPAYIAMVGVLLAGIVFFNVDVLELNHGIASTDARASQLKRENAALTLQLATLGSSERIQRVALQRGLVLPQPGDVRYLRAEPGDASHALRVMTAPDASAATPITQTIVSQQSGPAPVGATPTTTVTPTTTTTTTPAAGTTTTSPAPSSTTSQSAPPSTTPSSGATSQAPAPATSAGAAAAPATTAQTP